MSQRLLGPNTFVQGALNVILNNTPECYFQTSIRVCQVLEQLHIWPNLFASKIKNKNIPTRKMPNFATKHWRKSRAWIQLCPVEPCIWWYALIIFQTPWIYYYCISTGGHRHQAFPIFQIWCGLYGKINYWAVRILSPSYSRYMFLIDYFLILTFKNLMNWCTLEVLHLSKLLPHRSDCARKRSGRSLWKNGRILLTPL